MNNSIPDFVQIRFDTYSTDIKAKLIQLRTLIVDVAQQHPSIGVLEETVKWGQVSYLTTHSQSGTTVRIDQFSKNEVALFVHCQTTLIDECRGLFPMLKFSGNRGIIIPINEPTPENDLRICIELALTYKLRKQTQRKKRVIFANGEMSD